MHPCRGFGPALPRLRSDDLLNGRRIRPEAVDERTARRGGLAQRDERGRFVGLVAAERHEHADDRAEDEPGDREPPECDEGTTPAREVDVALTVEVYRHRRLTLPEPAHVMAGTAHGARAPRARTGPGRLRPSCGRRHYKPEYRGACPRRPR